MPSRSVVFAVVLVLALPAAGVAGDTDSQGPPASTSSFSLEDLYQRLVTGAVGTQDVFTEPATTPGNGTMHTIDEIMTVAPAADDINGSAPDEVVSGRTYWGLRTDGSWGTQTGTRAPCTADADADGIPDCNDQCPSDPDKGLPGACGCGVQESGGDWDGDGVVDCLDLCPLPGDEVMVGDACFSLLQQCLVIVSVTPDANGDGCIDGFSGAPSASCSQCTPLCGPITIGGPP